MRGIFVFTMMIFSSFANAKIDVYGGMYFGDVEWKESYLGNNFEHGSEFFVGHWGAGFGVKPMLTLGAFEIGLVGEAGWVGDTMQRKQTLPAGGTANNRVEYYRVMGGASAGFSFGKSFGIYGDYYSQVENTITFSNTSASNPFRSGDKMKGSGYGVALKYSYFEKAPAYVMYRRLTYTDIQNGGTWINLPSTRYTSQLVVEDVLASAIFSF